MIDKLTDLISMLENNYGSAAAYPFDLGSFGRSTSTSSVEAQRWFDRGLVWSYAFNHEEAIRCFEAAVVADDRFALAHWGIAYAAGPNYNKQWDAFDQADLHASLRRAYEATQRALELSTRGPTSSATWSTRSASATPAPSRRTISLPGRQLRGAMRPVYRRHPDDLDVAALYGDALMNVSAWSLWTSSPASPPRGSKRSRPSACSNRRFGSRAVWPIPGCSISTST